MAFYSALKGVNVSHKDSSFRVTEVIKIAASVHISDAEPEKHGHL